MRTWFAAALPLILALGGALPDAAQGATQHFGFLCRLDLNSAGEASNNPALIGRPAAYTFDSRKLCTPSANDNLRIWCSGRVEDWAGGNLNVKNVPCQINGSQCGVAPPPGEEFLTATSSQLHIKKDGRADLQCSFKQPKPKKK